MDFDFKMDLRVGVELLTLDQERAILIMGCDEMAIRGYSLDQTREFEARVGLIQKKLNLDLDYRMSVVHNDVEYKNLKNYFIEHVGFLKYAFDVEIEYLYRVRRLKSADPFRERSALLYPPACADGRDRMSNMSSRVLYVSLHEFTAMTETRLDEGCIGCYFQLTKFSPNRKIRAFKLGMFSELYKDSPRDSSMVSSRLTELFGDSCSDRVVQGYSALECAVADVLYSQADNYHILSSIMADAIFAANESIEAIIYPSVQGRYGTNLALRKGLADDLEIRASFVNVLEDVYRNGFFKYRSIMECSSVDDGGNLAFSDLKETGFERHVYR